MRGVNLVVVNTQDGRAEPGELARIISGSDADLVALIETGSGMTARLKEHLPPGFRSWCSVDNSPDVDSVALLAAPCLRELEVRENLETRFPYLEVKGPVLRRNRLVVFHAVAPFPPGSTTQWRADHRRIASWCRDPDVIVAGDLNSTLDHSVLNDALGNHRDAASEAGQGLTGTWPAALPRWAGVQLDHVLVPPLVRVTKVQIVNVPGSDHRALVVQLRL